MRLAFVLGIASCLIFSIPASSDERRQQLYASGDYLEAARLARLENSDASWAFAARSILAHSLTQPLDESSRLSYFGQAANDATHALAINPDNVEASLNLAIALGHRVQIEGPWSPNALFLTWKARDHIDHALDKDPDNSWANATLAAWQMSVSHYAGDFLAGLLFDTSWEEGKARYISTLEEQPDSLLLNYYFAEALQLKSSETDVPVMLEALEVATRATPENKLQEDVQLQAVEMLGTLSAQAAEKVQLSDKKSEVDGSLRSKSVASTKPFIEFDRETRR